MPHVIRMALEMIDQGKLALMKNPLVCPDCHASLKKVNYQIWGTKRFDSKTGSYQEDESLGETDMEFTCPNCSAKLDAEPIIAD